MSLPSHTLLSHTVVDQNAHRVLLNIFALSLLLWKRTSLTRSVPFLLSARFVIRHYRFSGSLTRCPLRSRIVKLGWAMLSRRVAATAILVSLADALVASSAAFDNALEVLALILSQLTFPHELFRLQCLSHARATAQLTIATGM